jgi:maltooligosyltrehalose trehalohydrolase
VAAVHEQIRGTHAEPVGLPDVAPGPLGALWRDNVCEFTVWAPFADSIEVQLVREHRIFELEPVGQGYFRAAIGEVKPDSRYFFRLNKSILRGDPVSRFQPEGVFGPSSIVDTSSFGWDDHEWRGIELKHYILYELHVGVYTPSGTFDELNDRIADLKALGVTAVEIMPVAQFSGARNWGYDGVFPFAVQNTYGGPRGLQRFINVCHTAGLAVVLDVVYNHLGPEGNFLGEFGPYFTDRYRTPWGQAINFDGPHSDHVARYFLQNALYWLEEFHVDALRLDAIHGIFDRNARPFLSLLSAAVAEFARRSGRLIHLIAESDLNAPAYVRSQGKGGYGLDAQWNDDFHHSLHALQTGERAGYYCDFGSLSHLQTAFQHGYVYSGQYSAFRKQRHGAPPEDIRHSQLVVFSQNHDQVGNRGWGERSSQLIDFEAQKLSAGAVLLSPFLPLLFMGEEYGETAPFLFFTDHSDPGLAKSVRDGRRAEFAGFHVSEEVPDPQSESTFQRSKLDPSISKSGRHRTLLDFYKELVHLRRQHAAFAELDGAAIHSSVVEKCLIVQRSDKGHESLVIFNFSDKPEDCPLPTSDGRWQKVVDSAETRWAGPGTDVPARIERVSELKLSLQPRSFCVFEDGSTRDESRETDAPSLRDGCHA